MLQVRQYLRALFDYPDIMLMVGLMATMPAIALVAMIKFFLRRRMLGIYRFVVIAVLIGLFAYVVAALVLPPLGRN